MIDLALIEREWLAVYRSKDGTALSSADLATLNGEALLNFPIATHPASRLIVLSGPLSPHLGVDMKDDMKGKSETERAERVEGITETVRVEGKEGEEGKGIINPYALWIVRPEAEIGFHILDKLSTRLLIALMPAGNMFQHVPDMPVNMVSNALSAISGADPQNISHPDALLAASVIDKGGSVNNRQKGPILTMGGLISYALDEEDETGALARIIDLIDRGGLIKEM